MVELNKKLQARFDIMCATGKLFRSSLSGQEVWDLYLKSFENDPIFRDPKSSSHNCNLCNNFIRRYGNIVAIDANYEIMSIFDVKMDDEYASPVTIVSTALRNAPIVDVFFETYNELESLPYGDCKKSNEKFNLGIAVNRKRYTKAEAELYGVVKENQTVTFNHLHLKLSSAYVDQSGKSVESIIADYRTSKEVFQRAMETISLDTFKLVKDLAVQGSLLDVQAHLYKIEQMIPMKKAYDKFEKSKQITELQVDNYLWVTSYKLPFAKFRNELIGKLCAELSEGEELNTAVRAWNKRVDPVNYMKTSAPVTEAMRKQAIKDFIELGYAEADLERRCATIDDIKASEILHLNVGKGELKTVSIFDAVKPAATSRHKRNEFDAVESVSIEKFMTDILPGCASVEAFLSNKHEKNMVTMLTGVTPGSKDIFKWKNQYNWNYVGNLAGKSQIKEAVKSAGGAVDGVLRFSIMWSGDGVDNSDLDAHCVEPSGGDHIYYSYKTSYKTGGVLDIDITQPLSQMPKGAVENITYPDLEKMINGAYHFYIKQYNGRNSKGFKAEIEFDGAIYSYESNKPLSGEISVAVVTLKNGVLSIDHKLPVTEGGSASKDIYGLQSNEFHKVNLVCLSPNHWGENAVGNKHYFFMLDGCKSPVALRSFHNENLNSELVAHRKFMDALGGSLSIESTDKQLSGLGFDATVHDEVIVRLTGNFKRMLRITF